jgi:single-stranded DNA-binding protein
MDEWDDKEGKRRHKLCVILEKFNFVGGKSENAAPSKEPANKSPIDDADVPF